MLHQLRERAEGARPRFVAAHGFQIGHTSILGLGDRSALGGDRTACEIGGCPPVRHGAGSQVIADLPIGARGGLRHHGATAKECCPSSSATARQPLSSRPSGAPNEWSYHLEGAARITVAWAARRRRACEHSAARGCHENAHGHEIGRCGASGRCRHLGALKWRGSTSSSGLPEAFQRAMACHRAGNLVEAERLYRQICAADPQARRQPPFSRSARRADGPQ